MIAKNSFLENLIQFFLRASKFFPGLPFDQLVYILYQTFGAMYCKRITKGKFQFIFSWLSKIKSDLKLEYANPTKDSFAALKFFVSAHPHFSYMLRRSMMLKKYHKKRFDRYVIFHHRFSRITINLMEERQIGQCLLFWVR